MGELISLRLKGVVRCSFQRSEITNLYWYQGDPSYPGDLEPGEAFLFLSKMGNQVIFMFHEPVSYEQGGRIRRVTDSRRLRLDSGTWSPYMLQDYAEAVGLHLVGIKRFEQVHDEAREAKANKRKGSS